MARKPDYGRPSPGQTVADIFQFKCAYSLQMRGSEIPSEETSGLAVD